MGYYADLIKQKQEKRNSAESHLKGLIGKKFKRDTDLERAVNSSIYTEISDWSHPRMVVFDKYTDEKYILTTEDNNQYGKDQEFWISKVQKANSKEEKDNEDPQIATLRRKALQKIKEAQKKADWYGDTVMQKFEKDLTYAEEEDVPELAGALDRYLPKFEAKVKSFGNSKGEDMGYYADLIKQKQEKRNSRSFKDIESAFRYLESKGYTIERRDWHKSHPKSWEWLPVTKDGKKDTIEFFKLSDGTIEVSNSKEEEGYYAKLAEEKKNSSYNIVWDGELYSIDTYKKALFVEVTVKRKYEKEKARLDSDYQRFRSSIEKIISEVPNK